MFRNEKAFIAKILTVEDTFSLTLNLNLKNFLEGEPETFVA